MKKKKKVLLESLYIQKRVQHDGQKKIFLFGGKKIKRENGRERERERETGQCDRPDANCKFSNVWPFTTAQMFPIAYRICQIGSKICQILNKLSNICRRLLKFCLSGDISRNLATLIM